MDNNNYDQERARYNRLILENENKSESLKQEQRGFYEPTEEDNSWLNMKKVGSEKW